MAKLIRADGITEDVRPKNKKKFSLKELQEFVGGYIEKVPSTNGVTAFCNEDGHSLKLPINLLASMRFRQTLVGNVIVCDESEVD